MRHGRIILHQDGDRGRQLPAWPLPVARFFWRTRRRSFTTALNVVTLTLSAAVAWRPSLWPPPDEAGRGSCLFGAGLSGSPPRVAGSKFVFKIFEVLTRLLVGRFLLQHTPPLPSQNRAVGIMAYLRLGLGGGSYTPAYCTEMLCVGPRKYPSYKAA